MKTILKSIFALGAAALFAVSCNVDNVGTLYDFSEDSAGVSFLNNAVTQTSLAATQTSYTVTVARRSAEGSLTAKLSSTLPPEIGVPGSVSFADGQATADVVIDLSKMAVGTAYKGNIVIESETDDLARKSLPCTFQKAYTFSKFGTGTYHYNEDCFFSGDGPGLEIYKADGFEVYYITNWGMGVDFHFSVNADGQVVVDDNFTGYTHSSYGKVNVIDCTSYWDDWDPATEGAGFYDASSKTFYFLVVYYVSAGYFGYGYEAFTVD